MLRTVRLRRMPVGTRIYTVGYQGVSMAQVLDSLEHAGVTLVVDTRETPTSRRVEFRSRRMAAALLERSIQYVSLPQLGAPKALRETVFRWQEFAAGYRSRLAQHPATVEQLVKLARGHRVCLLCFEDDPQACHRSLLVDELERQLSSVTALHLRPGRVDKANDSEGVGVGLHRAHDEL